MYNFKKNGSTRSGKNLNGEILKTADLNFPLDVFPPLLQAYAKSAHNAFGTSIEHLYLTTAGFVQIGGVFPPPACGHLPLGGHLTGK